MWIVGSKEELVLVNTECQMYVCVRECVFIRVCAKVLNSLCFEDEKSRMYLPRIINYFFYTEEV